MYHIKDLGYKQSTAIRWKIMVQTDGIDFGMYSQMTFRILVGDKISWRLGKQYTSPPLHKGEA